MKDLEFIKYPIFINDKKYSMLVKNEKTAYGFNRIVTFLYKGKYSKFKEPVYIESFSQEIAKDRLFSVVYNTSKHYKDKLDKESKILSQIKTIKEWDGIIKDEVDEEKR